MGDSTAALFGKELQPPTDTLGNKYYQILNPGYDATFAEGMEFWVAYNSAAGANTVTATDNSNDALMSLYEIAGLATYAAFDQSATQNQTSSPYSSGATPTTSYAHEIAIGAFVIALNSALTAGGSYVNMQNIGSSGGPADLGTEELIVSSTGAQTATATSTTTDAIAAVVTLADTGAVAQSAIKLLGATFNTTSGTHTVTATPAVNDLIVIIQQPAAAQHQLRQPTTTPAALTPR